MNIKQGKIYASVKKISGASQYLIKVPDGIDYKLDSNWTLNVVSLRYRNAFSVTWITPKISTGITYNIDQMDSDIV